MQFTSVPANGASLCAPLIFAFGDQADPRTLDVEIYHAQSGDLLFKKRLYHTSAGEVDIAPLLRRLVRFDPSCIATGFFKLPNRFLPVRVRVEEASVERTFLPAEHLPEGYLLTSMPTSRLLARGDKEELFLRPGITRAIVRYQTPTESTSRIFTNSDSTQPCGFGVTTHTLPEGVERMEVALYVGNELAHTIHYTIIPVRSEGVRLAWVGRQGAIEHYTFPRCESRTEEQSRHEGLLAEGASRLLQATVQEQWLITSAYERTEVLEALAEIGTAPQLWLVSESGTYTPIGVKAGSHQLFRRGVLTAMQFTLCSTVKQLSLWS